MTSSRGPYPRPAEDPLGPARRAVAQSRFREALQVLTELAQQVGRTAEWHLLMAMASWRLGDFATGRSSALSARRAYRAVGDVDGEMRSENVAAAGAFALGDLEEAEERLNRAWQLAQELGDELMSARCANNLGNVAFYGGRHHVALSLYALAATGFERVAFVRGMAESWHNMGGVWRDLGQLSESLDAAERAVLAAERVGDPRLVGQTVAARGEAHALLGDQPLARVEVQRALELARNTHDRLSEIEALRVVALIERLGGNHEAAEQRARDAAAIAEEVRHPWLLAKVLRDLGEVYLAMGRRERAVGVLQDAAAAYERAGAVERAGQITGRVSGLRGRR